ncbi:MAG TPA: ElyC/SanA/YdcF family protein [Anaerolineaceae bacterium]|nr:DUF218 domain-containing protein [Chloroflexota bacterium]HNY83784.1 ElyC/SanA/YdcF family protein [Anaerolineaceae bacterium]
MLRKLFRFLLISILVISLLTVGIRLGVIAYAAQWIVPKEQAPQSRVVIVPGAGLTYMGTPSLALQDRLDEAIRLYHAGKIQKILMSGDNSYASYNEPGAMRAYALSQGIPESDIVLDYAGRRTYDTCYRAKAIFGIDEAIFVTQQYHLSRAVFLCQKLGVKATGIAIRQSAYPPERYAFWQFREVFATVAAVWDIFVARPLPILGEAEPIFTE